MDASVGTNFEGRLARVALPLSKSSVFSEFHPYWVAFSHQIDGKIVRVVKKSLMVHAPYGILSEECFNGWEVDPLDNKFRTSFSVDGRLLPSEGIKTLIPGKDFACWLPEKWLTNATNIQLSLF